jgi:hypothetical protein
LKSDTDGRLASGDNDEADEAEDDGVDDDEDAAGLEEEKGESEPSNELSEDNQVALFDCASVGWFSAGCCGC